MHSSDLKSPLNEANTRQSAARRHIEKLLAEVRLEPGDPFESLLRALVEIVGVAYAAPEVAAGKVDRAFEKRLVEVREKLADEFAAGAEKMRRNNLEAGRQITEAREELSAVVSFLKGYAGQLEAAKSGLGQTAETITTAAVAGLEKRLLPALAGFEQTVEANGRRVAEEYRAMKEISGREVAGVRFWSRFTYGAIFASAALLWLAACLASYVWLDLRHGREYQSRLAEVEANYAANNAALKKLAGAGVNLVVEERRDQHNKLVPGQHVVAVPGAVSVYTSTTGYGVVVFRGKK